MGESFHKATISDALHESGLYEKAARRKPLLKECCIYSIPQAMSETQQTRGRSSSGQMRRKLELFALDAQRYVCRKPNILHTYLTMNTPSLLAHMVVTASCYWRVFLQHGQGS